MRVNGKLIACALVLVTSTVTMLLGSQNTYAAQVTSRSLTLITGAGGDGGSKVSGLVKHEFKFTVPSNTSVGSIKFQYCTTAAGTCTMPTGLVTDGGAMAIDDQQGATGFTLNKTTNGSPYIHRTAAQINAATVVTIRFTNITNPSTLGTFFARINLYTSEDTTGSSLHYGTVTASTANDIQLSGTMPESLIFCTGAIIQKTNGIPDCSTATAGTVEFNQLFSPTDTATATSQMAASTNATGGYTITVNGATLQSGGNSVAAMTSQDFGMRGKSQFGMNLKLNTVLTSTVAVGAEVSDASNGTDLRGQAVGGYATVDKFKFVTGETVADSAFNTAGPTNAQIFTVSYIVNVPGSQVAGTYTTTLTYVCTPTF